MQSYEGFFDSTTFGKHKPIYSAKTFYEVFADKQDSK